MKSKEELNKIKEEYETLNEKLAELSEEELKEVVGGYAPIDVDTFSTWEVIPTIG